MGVNEENQVETKKQNAWVLTYSHYVSGQRSDPTRLKVYMEKPTITDLACYFEKHGDEIIHGGVVRAVVFLEHLVNGLKPVGADLGGWYDLEEVTES